MGRRLRSAQTVAPQTQQVRGRAGGKDAEGPGPSGSRDTGGRRPLPGAWESDLPFPGPHSGDWNMSSLLCGDGGSWATNSRSAVTEDWPIPATKLESHGYPLGRNRRAGGHTPQELFIEKCASILARLNFSLLRGPPCWMPHTCRDAFSTARNSL